MSTRRNLSALAIAVALAYLVTIPLANWTLERFGFVPIGFGLEAPAGVWFAAVALTLRDVVQELLGRWVVALLIVLGALISLLISPAFALASAAAFGVSEFLDFAVYTPLRNRKRLVTAALASNVVGGAVDSLLFLWLAFGALTGFTGLFVGKLWIGMAGALALLPFRQRILTRRPVAV